MFYELFSFGDCDKALILLKAVESTAKNIKHFIRICKTLFYGFFKSCTILLERGYFQRVLIFFLITELRSDNF